MGWTAPNYHNWHQIKTALEKNGFIQTPTFEEPYLHFMRGDGKEVIYEKSNKISVDATKTILKKGGITYDEFLELYH